MLNQISVVSVDCVHLMCLVSAFLQSHVCQAVEFLQGNEMNAALSASLLDLYTL